MKGFVWGLALLLTGCLGTNGSKTASGGDSAVDSIIYHAEMSDFACYYPAGKFDRRRLENTIALIAANGSFPDEKFSFWTVVRSGVPVPGLKAYYDHVMDSMSRVELLDFEPWISFRERILDYNRRQYARELLNNEGIGDPRRFYAYEGLAQDSTLQQSVDILVEAGEGLVDNTRRHLTGIYNLPSEGAGDASVREYNIELLNRRLSGSDSVQQAKEMLYVTVSNRINAQIHAQNNILEGDGMSRYEEELLRIFDSVREFNICEP